MTAPVLDWLSWLWNPARPVIEPASQRDVAALARIHGDSFHRGWGKTEFDAMLREPGTMIHRLRRGREVVGFAVSRQTADEAEILSIAVSARARGRGLSRALLMTHLGHLAGRGVRAVFLEVEENNQPACRLYRNAGFEVVGRRENYYNQGTATKLNALVMRRDLS
ncbi:MAG: ribosomal protein S18-alanine N-acetyltransferase [Xanthobacteraceae bacterium]|nr:ribosomal protein S18-alanine N-acetyltransferase [Xanthobacteraceae bacterium]